jgi:hypothetical protein
MLLYSLRLSSAEAVRSIDSPGNHGPIIGPMLDWFVWTPVTMWMVGKAVLLGLLVLAVSFWYTYRTGRNITDDISARRSSAEQALPDKEAG